MSEVIGTIEVLLLVVGLVELLRALGLKGWQLIVVAMLVATLLGLVSYAMSEGILVDEAATWARIVVGALWVGVKGLAAAGLVKFGVDRAERLMGQLAFVVRDSPCYLPQDDKNLNLWWEGEPPDEPDVKTVGPMQEGT